MIINGCRKLTKKEILKILEYLEIEPNQINIRFKNSNKNYNLGRFYPYDESIVIYKNPHNSIYGFQFSPKMIKRRLIETLLHEIKHFLQYKKNPKRLIKSFNDGKVKDIVENEAYNYSHRFRDKVIEYISR